MGRTFNEKVGQKAAGVPGGVYGWRRDLMYDCLHQVFVIQETVNPVIILVPTQRWGFAQKSYDDLLGRNIVCDLNSSHRFS